MQKEQFLVNAEFPFKDSLSVEKVIRNNCIQWNIHSSWTEWVYNLEPQRCKITQCLCTRPKAGSECSRAPLSIRCLEAKFKKERAKQKILTPHGGREKQLISAPKRRRAVMFCVMSWKTRGSREQRGISSPHKQTSKNKQFHPTEKEMGQWDKREGQTGVRKEWHLWRRALGEKLEMRGGAEDKGVFVKGASDCLSPSFWPAGLVWILG